MVDCPPTLDAFSVGLLVASGLVAGFVNTVAGGGSLLTLPALMFAGLPAVEANATNRVCVLAQTLTAARGFAKEGHLSWRDGTLLLFPTLVGAVAGAWLATEVPESVMEPLLLVLLVVSSLAVALSRSPVALGEGGPPTRGRKASAWVLMLACGFYGGFLQAGLGFLMLATLLGLMRLDLLRANGLKALLMLPLTLVALGIFVGADLVRWGPGLVLAAASVVGTRIALRVALKNPRSLRWLVFASVALSASVLLFR